MSNGVATKSLTLFFSALLVLLPTRALTQSGRGHIYGVVADETGAVLPGVTVHLTNDALGTAKTTVTNAKGEFRFRFLPKGSYSLVVELPGFVSVRREAIPVKPGLTTNLPIQMSIATVAETITVTAESPIITSGEAPLATMAQYQQTEADWRWPSKDFNTEAYDNIEENAFRRVVDHPLSTFSIDVDTASYSNARRFLNQYQLPPPDSVRVEELVNYFIYSYPGPEDDVPFAVTMDASLCPWEPDHQLVRIGLKGKEISSDDRPPSNLVFLLDVSGSMEDYNKLPLVKKTMRMLTARLNDRDQVAIAVYAGASGLVLPSTPGTEKQVIAASLERLRAGGSTNGGEGIQLAYSLAAESFIKGGVNRVILCTDGDFNVGITNQGDLVDLIEKQARRGIFLSVLGFGMGNYKDSTLEKLADKGNGNYAYIDTINEARKVLVEQLNATLFTIAKDVKIQVEFNPERISSYRLIGYENRILAKEDFNDDEKDAGEIGAGHTVTALYQVVPAGREMDRPAVDDLKYQREPNLSKAAASNELLTVKLRYKEPEGSRSKLLDFVLSDDDIRKRKASRDFRFAAAVASFGMLLRESEHRGAADWKLVLRLAKEGRGDDPHGYRSEFINLVEIAGEIQREQALLNRVKP